MGSLVVYLLAMRPAMQQTEAMGWNEVPCVIREIGIEAKQIKNGNGANRVSTGYGPKVEFEYTVNGQVFSSKQFWFGSRLFNKQSEVQEMIHPFEKGGEYSCWVDPNNPAVAVLDRDTRDDSLVGWLVGGLFAAIGGIGCLASLWTMIRPSGSSHSISARPSINSATPGSEPGASLSAAGFSTYFDADVCPEEGNDPDDPLILKQEYSRSTVAIGVWFFALVWNGFIGFFLYLATSNGIPFFAMIFLGIFALIGVAILWGAIYKTLQVWNPLTTVVCSQRYLYPVASSK